MTSSQRVIKYIAIAFAVLLSVSIIGGIVSAVAGFTGRGIHFGNMNKVGTSDFTNEFEDISSLDLGGFVGEIVVKTGNQSNVTVEGTKCPDDLKVEKDGSGTLNVHEDSGWFHWLENGNWDNKGTKLTITFPESIKLDEIELDGGVGNVTIENLKTADLNVDGGVGNTTIRGVTAECADVDGGTGNLDLEQIQFGDTDISGGVGDVKVSGTIKGDIDLDGGVGEVEMNLDGSREEYNFDIDTGMGDITVDDAKMSSMEEDNDGRESFEIDGGLGDIQVNFSR